MAFPDGIADFRSDTVTRPTAEMRRAMADAEVGDDVYGEDPTVNALEEEAAVAIGKGAAVFVPSGVMGNQIAVNLQARPGREVVCVEHAHVRNYEAGAASAWSGVAFRPVPVSDGVMPVEMLEEAFASTRYAPPGVDLLTWENTHNYSGGTIVPVDVMVAGSRLAAERGIAVHLDGARLWNAAVASGVPGAAYAAAADTVMFCLSKGLGAPLGSLLCGSVDLIQEARYVRRKFGGAMRQVGIVAAAGRIALRDRDRLREDHELAALLARKIAERFPGAVDVASVHTNMVRVNEKGLPITAQELVAVLGTGGVRVGLMGPGVLRFVTHRDVDRSDVDRVVAVLDRLSR